MNLLQGVWLDQTRVTDAGMASLGQTRAGWLYLRGTRVGDVGLQRLYQSDHNGSDLRGLGLHNTRVTDAGLETLREARARSG